MEVKNSVPEDISTLLADNKVFMFSKTTCPYCDQSKSLFQKNGVAFEVLEADKVNFTQKHKDDLFKLSKLKTYPNIFIGKKPIGGCDSLKELQKTGKLYQLLKDANIEFD